MLIIKRNNLANPKVRTINSRIVRNVIVGREEILYCLLVGLDFIGLFCVKIDDSLMCALLRCS